MGSAAVICTVIGTPSPEVRIPATRRGVVRRPTGNESPPWFNGTLQRRRPPCRARRGRRADRRRRRTRSGASGLRAAAGARVVAVLRRWQCRHRPDPRSGQGLRDPDFGTNDKPALLVGMAVVLALIGVAIGLISRRSAMPGRRPSSCSASSGCLPCASSERILEPACAAASLLAGVGVFWWLHRGPRPTARRPTRRRRRAGWRGFVVGALAAAVGAGGWRRWLRVGPPGRRRRVASSRRRTGADHAGTTDPSGRRIPRTGHADVHHRRPRLLPHRHQLRGTAATHRECHAAHHHLSQPLSSPSQSIHPYFGSTPT